MKRRSVPLAVPQPQMTLRFVEQRRGLAKSPTSWAIWLEVGNIDVRIGSIVRDRRTFWTWRPWAGSKVHPDLASALVQGVAGMTAQRAMAR